MCKVIEYKLIDGFEDYMVSSEGKVWSLNYGRTGKMKELKPNTIKGGYLQVCLCNGDTRVMKLVQRLVAEAFIPNPNNRPQVNHIDQKKTNNCVENLEWCTADYNNNYGDRNERAAKTLTNRKDRSTPVVCLETAVVYPSTHEASRQTGVNQRHISECCNGKLKTAGGFHWAKSVEGEKPIYS